MFTAIPLGLKFEIEKTRKIVESQKRKAANIKQIGLNQTAFVYFDIPVYFVCVRVFESLKHSTRYKCMYVVFLIEMTRTIRKIDV